MNKFLFFILLLQFARMGVCQNLQTLQRIQALVQEYKEEESLVPATYSFCIMNAKNGKVYSELNSKLSLVPASTLKVLTTAAITAVLGTQYRYETQLLYTGSWDSLHGTINGNIIIKGSGDPSLGSAYFPNREDSLSLLRDWATILKSKGIKKIQGDIIADASCFDDQLPDNWIWGDIGNYYGAGACGLSYQDNKYAVYFKTGSVGEAATVKRVHPPVNGLELEQEVKAGGHEDNAYIYGGPGQWNRKISGTIPANKDAYEVEGSLPDPALFCAQEFRKSLQQQGISITGKATSSYKKVQRETKLIYQHRSSSLEKMIYFTNLKSNNHYAESFLKTIGLKKEGQGTTAAGCKAVLQCWKERGINTAGIYLNDGSGLSRSNGISTFQQAQILSKIHRDTALFRVIYHSLPIAGQSGSLTNLCKGSFAEKNLRAKSGYITRARAYCGYVTSRSGELLSFSVIFNNYTCSASEVKVKMEKLLNLIAEL